MTIRQAFLIAIIAGTLPIIASFLEKIPDEIQLIAALAVLTYGIFVFIEHAREKRAADSVYYLGFIFTLLALLVSLLPLAFNGEGIEPERVLSAFSVALSTTLVGLVIRTLIVQFMGIEELTPEELQEQLIHSTRELVVSLDLINGQLTKTNKSLTSSFNRLTSDVDNLVAKLTQRLEELSEKSQTDMARAGEKFLKNLDQANASISKSVLAIMENSKTAETEIAQASLLHVDAIESSRTALKMFMEENKTGLVALQLELQRLAETSLTTIKSAVEVTVKETADARNQLVFELDAALASVGDKVESSLRGSMDKLIQGIDTNFGEIGRHLTDQFGQLTKQFPDFENVAASLQLSLNRLDALLSSVRQGGQKLEEDLRAVGQVSQALTSLGGGINALAAQIEAFQGSAANLKQLVSEMDDNLKSAQRTQQQLTEMLIRNANDVVEALGS